ncbi:MAG: alpha/beta hydrolase [Luteolibacter sp.]
MNIGRILSALSRRCKRGAQFRSTSRAFGVDCFGMHHLVFRVIFSSWLVLACCGAQEEIAGEAQAESALAQLFERLNGSGNANQLFYFPTRDEPATPEKWGFDYQDIRFQSADGTKLHGWFIPAHGAIAKATVIFSHGNAGSIGHHLGFVMWLVEAGYHVVMFDYRGFGKSAGQPDRRGMIDDVKAAIAHAARIPSVDRFRLISYGHSLGGAKSLTAIGESPVRGLRAVVVDGAFASYRTMAQRVAGQLGERLVTDELAPLDYVEKISPVPLLVVHGGRDKVVPIDQGRELFRAAAQPKTLFEVREAGHGDALARDHGAYRKRMLAWLDKQLGG